MYSNAFGKVKAAFERYSKDERTSKILFEVNLYTNEYKWYEISEYIGKIIVVDGDNLVIGTRGLSEEQRTEFINSLKSNPFYIEINIADRQGTILEKLVINDAKFAGEIESFFDYDYHNDNLFHFVAK